MRLKPVPPAPGDLEDLGAARRAVPLVPGSEDDCCARLQQRVDLPSRDLARTWLTFLRALGLAEETRTGFVRTRDDVDEAALSRRFRDGVFAAEEVLEALSAADGPLPADEVFERVADVVPQWERHRSDGWEATWRERVRRLLDWAVLVGLAESVERGYRVVGDGGGGATG